MKIAFLDTATLGDDLDLSPFEDLGPVVYHHQTSPADRLPHLADIEVAVLNKVKLDAEVLAGCPQLKLIALTATGYNNVDLEAARQLGIAVANVRNYSTASVAQHTLAMLLALMEQLPYLDHYTKSGQYSRSTNFTHLSRTWHEIAGLTWGIVGLGQIGQAVAGLAEALGATVIYYSLSGQDRDSRRQRVDWPQLLARSDIISIHAPLTPASRDLFDATALRQLKRTAWLVNVGRGGIIDEAALAAALDHGHLAGAALDVLEQEPPPADNPLLHLRYPDRLLLTPHTAWASVESRRRCLAEVLANLRAWQRGESRNRVDQTIGE